MSFGSYLKNGFKTLVLDEQAITDNSQDKDGLVFGIVTILIAGLAAAIG